MKKLLSTVLTMVMVFTFLFGSMTTIVKADGALVSTTTIDTELESTLNAYTNESDSKQLGNAQWVAMYMKSLGKPVDKSFITLLISDIQKKGLSKYSNNDLSKAIMSLTAAGYSPYNFMGQNIVETLFSRDIASFQSNDLIYALDAYNYANINGNYKITKQALENQLISKKLSFKSTDGNNYYYWNYSSTEADGLDFDTTGMALNALAPYYSDVNVKNIIDSAVNGIAQREDDTGCVLGQWGISSNTNSMVIVGLTSLGIDPQGEKFTKSGNNLVSGLLSFKGTEGMYQYITSGDYNGNNDMATEQAIRAFLSLQKFNNSSGKIYNFYSSEIDASKLSLYIPIDSNINTETSSAPTANTTSAISNTLPQTGSNIDTNILLLIGGILLASGLALIFIKKKESSDI